MSVLVEFLQHYLQEMKSCEPMEKPEQVVAANAIVIKRFLASIFAVGGLLNRNKEIAYKSITGVILVGSGIVVREYCTDQKHPTIRKIARFVQGIGFALLVYSIALLLNSENFVSDVFEKSLENSNEFLKRFNLTPPTP